MLLAPILRCLRTATAALLVLLIGGCTTPNRSSPPVAVADPALLVVDAPTHPEQRAYLGLAPEETQFRIAELPAEVLIIVCFDLYCPSCQKAARYVNELYERVQASGYGGRVKFLGLGLGDSPLEVATFRDKYRVPFPLFPDRSNQLARQFGEVRVPGLLVVQPGNPPRVLHREFGIPRHPEQLLEHIIEDLERNDTENLPVQGLDPVECDAEVCPIELPVG